MNFYVPCLPAGMPRVRATNRGKHAAVYTPTTIGPKGARRPHPAIECKAQIRAAFAAAGMWMPLQGPVRVDWVALFPRPSNKVWKAKPMKRYPHTGSPDRDNLDKTILDALKDLAWRDDAQVCFGYTAKLVAGGDDQIGIYIRIVPISVESEGDPQVTGIIASASRSSPSTVPHAAGLTLPVGESTSTCHGAGRCSAPASAQSDAD